jgi:hypothetical protein
MTLADYSLAAFALLNGGRTVAYVPQMVRVYRDPHGATAVSLTTWLLFAAANIATVAYALAVADDRLVAFVFGLNAVGCLAIVALTAVMRARVASRAMLAAQIASLQSSAQLAATSDALRDSAAPWRDTPSARVRDEMIRQGGLG